MLPYICYYLLMHYYLLYILYIESLRLPTQFPGERVFLMIFNTRFTILCVYFLPFFLCIYEHIIMYATFACLTL